MAQDKYTSTITAEIKYHFPRFKFILIGKKGVGKSTFLRWLVSHSKPGTGAHRAIKTAHTSDTHTLTMTGHNISDAMILYDTRGLEDACGFLNNSKDSKYALLLAEGKAQEDCPLNIPAETWLPLWIWWALEWVWWALEWVWWATVGLLFFLFVQNKKRSRDWWPEGGMDYLWHWFFALCAFLVLVRGCNILYHIVNWVLGVAYSCLSWLFSLSSNQKSSGCTKSGFADRKPTERPQAVLLLMEYSDTQRTTVLKCYRQLYEGIRSNQKDMKDLAVEVIVAVTKVNKEAKCFYHAGCDHTSPKMYEFANEIGADKVYPIYLEDENSREPSIPPEAYVDLLQEMKVSALQYMQKVVRR